MMRSIKKDKKCVLNRILILIGVSIILSCLIAAKPNSTDNTVNLWETAFETYTSDESTEILSPLYSTINPGQTYFASFRSENVYTADFTGKFKIRVYVPDPVPQLENDGNQSDPNIYKHATIVHQTYPDSEVWNALTQRDWNRAAFDGGEIAGDKWWYILINKTVEWERVWSGYEQTYRYIVGNADFVWPCPTGRGDYYTNAVLTRGLESPIFEIESGQYIRIVPGERRDVWGDNAGGITFEIVPELKEFLIRDKSNHWNLIRHIPAENRYEDHKDIFYPPFEKIQVIVAADTTGQAKVNLEIDTEPEGTEDKMAWRASSQNVYPEGGSFDTDGKSEATIYSSGIGQEPYEFYVGFDSNRNRLLDAEEDTKSVNKVLLLTKSHVGFNFDAMLALVRVPDFFHVFKVASTNALIFLGKLNETNIASEIKATTIYRAEKDVTDGYILEHPVGADFSSATGIANIDLRKFTPDSITAKEIEDSATLRDWIEKHLAQSKDKILGYFAQPNSSNYHVFSFDPAPFMIDFEDHSVDDFDLYFGFGKAKVTYKLKVHVRRSPGGVLNIEKLFVDGTLEDLYDWDFYFGRPEDEMMAGIQFAWRSPPGDSAGRIFRIEVKFNKKFDEFPFPE